MPQDGGFGFRFRRPTPVVAWTLGILVAIWIAVALAVRFAPGGDELYASLVLRPSDIRHGRHLWTLVTAGLLHSLDDTDHLLFNGVAFYFFGPDLEEIWGRGRFVLFMFLTMLGGHGLVVLASTVGLSDATSVVGFSGVVMGVMVAWGLMFPDREMFLLFFRMKGIHLVYLTIALQLLGALSFSRVSAAGHFGGMAVGALFVATQRGPLRRYWLTRKLARLEAQAAGLRGRPGAPAGRREGGPALRLIKGGGGEPEPPKDPRTLN
jgi:membrane associated rhomboid family serine protease